MAKELIATRKISSTVTTDAAKAAVLKSGSRFGKSWESKKGNVIVAPKSAVNRVEIKTDVEDTPAGTSVVTYSA